MDQTTISIFVDFNDPNTQQEISRFCEQARKAISKDFVSFNLGAKHLDRNAWISHNSDLVNELFDLKKSQFAAIADGTYVYCQKSSNNMFQRKTYSGQKKRHLVKPFVICATDGYIVDVFGPYAATDNDAIILSDIMEKEKRPDVGNFDEILLDGDLFLLDRGFRDVALELKNRYKLLPKLPTCVSPDQKFLTTKEANDSRFVTKCRWVIEAINGIFEQSFRALKDVSNKILPHIIYDFRIAAAIINCYKRRLFSDGDKQLEIAKKMKYLSTKENHLEREIKNLKINNKYFEQIDATSVSDFPKINDLNQIRENIAIGSYQIKQCHGYLDEFLSMNGRNSLYISGEKFLTKKNNSLVCAEIQSRHVNRTKYKVFVEYEPHNDHINSIKGKYLT